MQINNPQRYFSVIKVKKKSQILNPLEKTNIQAKNIKNQLTIILARIRGKGILKLYRWEYKLL